MAHKGFFRPTQPNKYVGDPRRIVFRSSWELRVMRTLDTHPSVLSWSSEPVAIPYTDRTRKSADGSNSFHRYFPDFVIKIRRADGVVETLVVEVKPGSQSPIHSRLSAKRSLREGAVLARNACKWEAATRWASERGMTFRVLTERELGLWRH